MHSLLPLVLLFAPPEGDHEQATAELQTAVEHSTDEDRQAAIAALASAIERQSQHPDAASSELPTLVLEARVILIRLYLAEHNNKAAEQAMDDLLRTARDQTPPVRSYGQEVTDLYEARKAALQAAGTATLEFNCKVACTRVINERLSTATSEQLPVGPYRIWIKAADQDAEWVYFEVDLAAADTVKTITYADPTPVDIALPPPPPPARKRMLPRAAEISGLVAGVGLVVAGAVLLSLDGKCSKTNQVPGMDTSMEDCGTIYNTTVGGASLLGVGGGLLVVSGVLLSIDEVRVGRAKGQQVMVGATLRF
ncbi:hypothetical protein [Enhygromyxa salina]|nr:hypothetical protein [Enhygromyxa salina]